MTKRGKICVAVKVWYSNRKQTVEEGTPNEVYTLDTELVRNLLVLLEGTP